MGGVADDCIDPYYTEVVQHAEVVESIEVVESTEVVQRTGGRTDSYYTGGQIDAFGFEVMLTLRVQVSSVDFDSPRTVHYIAAYSQYSSVSIDLNTLIWINFCFGRRVICVFIALFNIGIHARTAQYA
jgi:hypothetical protein